MICHPGNRCGKVDHHASMIHDEQDSNKRVTLLQEFGDIFMHFVQVKHDLASFGLLCKPKNYHLNMMEELPS